MWICLEHLRNPRTLVSKHSFCKKCPESWQFDNKETTDSIICPQCKNLTLIPFGDVEAFRQIDMADKTQDDYTQKLCSKCSTSPDRMAKVYCQNCAAYICETCYNYHKIFQDLKHHVIVTVEDLASGKVKITKMEEQMCTKHEGEIKKFYCVTCQQLVCRDCIVMKQHCRDHDYVTLKEAAEEKLDELKEAMRQCDDKRKECQDAIQKSQAIKDRLNKASEKAKRETDLKKTYYLKQVEHFCSNQIDSINKLQNLEEKRIIDVNKLLQGNVENIVRASTQCQTLVESGSHYKIVANVKSVLETVQKVNQMTIKNVDASLVKFPKSVFMREFNHPWKQIQEFKLDCGLHGMYQSGIAVTSDGKVAVCLHNLSWSKKCLKVFSESDGLLHTFDGRLGRLGDICITSDDTYLYPLDNKSAIKYSSNYQVISEFKTVNANKQPSNARAVTVDKNGLLIFGMTDKAISIHNPDGSLKYSYTIPYRPDSVAVTSNAEVVVASRYPKHTVQLFDYSGNCLHTLDPPDEVTSWKPKHVCCSTTDEVFVENGGEPKAIYKYIAGRVCVGCVTREVDNPYGIALSHDDQILYVTEYDKKMVKKFQRP